MRRRPIERLQARDRLARHAHVGAYATLVLDGGYVEYGETGRIEAEPGDVLVHGPFCAHADRAGRKGAQLLNLALPARARTGRARPADVDSLIRLAASDPADAMLAITALEIEPHTVCRDWPDLLAARLGQAPLDLSEVAREFGLRPESLARGFKARFGVSPRSYAAEARARRAWRRIVESGDSLSTVAQEMGFCDQPHMSRAVMRLTGRPPGAWRVLPPELRYGWGEAADFAKDKGHHETAMDR